jgi:hypothetical protein
MPHEPKNLASRWAVNALALPVVGVLGAFAEWGLAQ